VLVQVQSLDRGLSLRSGELLMVSLCPVRGWLSTPARDFRLSTPARDFRLSTPIPRFSERLDGKPGRFYCRVPSPHRCTSAVTIPYRRPVLPFLSPCLSPSAVLRLGIANRA